MLSVYVHKDIGAYTEKVWGKMSARMCLCIGGGFAVSIATAAVCNLFLAIEVKDAAFPVMAASLPFWLMAFWKPSGMRPERYVPLLVRHELESGIVPYVPSPAKWLPARFGLHRPKADKAYLRKSRRKGAENAVFEEAA